MLYSKPTRLEDAVAALARGAKALAGGTDLLLHLGRGIPWPEAIVDLKALPELRELKRSEKGLVIGAGLPISELLVGETLSDYPALRRACELFAARQIRERATIGGNLMNASPAADTLPPLIAYGANCRSDRRVIAAEEICTGPGETCLAGNELLLDIELPSPAPGSLSFFHKLAPRDAMAIAIVGVAACLEMESGRVLRARIALGAIAPTVIRSRQAEAELLGKPLAAASIARAATAAMAECKPIDDIRASADYRRRMVGRILEYQLSLAASPR